MRLVGFNKGQWFFTAIYESLVLVQRESLWKKLKTLARRTQKPWLLAGDFNAYTSLKEKKGGGRPNSKSCNSFNRDIRECGLIVIGILATP